MNSNAACGSKSYLSKDFDPAKKKLAALKDLLRLVFANLNSSSCFYRQILNKTDTFIPNRVKLAKSHAKLRHTSQSCGLNFKNSLKDSVGCSQQILIKARDWLSQTVYCQPEVTF